MENYKNIRTGVVISMYEYFKLPNFKRNDYVKEYTYTSHKQDNNSDSLDFITGVATGLVIDNIIDSFDNDKYNSSSDGSFSSGGGDFGGGGSSDSW